MERSFGDLVRATDGRDLELLLGYLVATLDNISGKELDKIVRDFFGAIKGSDVDFSVGSVIIILEAILGVELKWIGVDVVELIVEDGIGREGEICGNLKNIQLCE